MRTKQEKGKVRKISGLNYVCEECFITKRDFRFDELDKPMICPECGKEMIQKEERLVRILNIMVKKVIDVSELFVPVVVEALRDYADLIEKTKGTEECYKFTSKNGCSIEMIHGSGDGVVNQ